MHLVDPAQQIIKDKLFLFLCLVGFLYQSLSLITEYMKGKTVVNIEIGQVFNDSLPAITVCPGSQAIDKLAKLTPEYQEFYDQYLKLTRDPPQNSRIMETLYYNFTSNVLQDINSGALNIDLYDLLKNYSHSYVNEMNQDNFEVQLSADGLEDDHFTKNVSHPVGNMRLISRPIESMILSNQLLKCFTFFSHLEDYWQKTKMNFVLISMSIVPDDATFPHKIYPFPMMMHSQNSMGTMSNGYTNPVKSHTFYICQFSTIKIRRLGPSYDTNCRQYGHGHQHQVRADCLTACFQDQHDKMCNDSGIAPSPVLIREKIIKEKRKLKVSQCREYRKASQKIRITCSDWCPHECEYAYFSLTMLKIADRNDSSTMIYIQHNQMPDLLIKYMPEISLISFVCNFGGLLGMWLGVSFLAIINALKRKLIKYMRRKPNNLFLKVQFNFNSIHVNENNGFVDK